MTPAELEVLLGEDFDSSDESRAQSVLVQAKAIIDGYCNRVALDREQETAVLRGRSSRRLNLPREPVVSVSEVKVDGDVTDDWVLVRNELVRETAASWGGPDVTVEVTYTRGFETPPEDIRQVVLKYAARLWVNPEQVMQKRFDDHSVSFASSIEEASRLLPDERNLLHKYRRTTL